MKFINNYKGINKDDWYLLINGDNNCYKIDYICIDGDEIDVIFYEFYSNKTFKGIRCSLAFDDFFKHYVNERKVKLDKINENRR